MSEATERERVAEAVGGALIDAGLASSDYAIGNVEAWNRQVEEVADAALAALQQLSEDDKLEDRLLNNMRKRGWLDSKELAEKARNYIATQRKALKRD